MSEVPLEAREYQAPTYSTRETERRNIFVYFEMFYNPKRKQTNSEMQSAVDFAIR